MPHSKNSRSYWYAEEMQCYVPIFILAIPTLDRINTLNKDGSCTEMGSYCKPWTVAEYHERYCYVTPIGWVYNA